jgi:hypothetical protein
MADLSFCGSLPVFSVIVSLYCLLQCACLFLHHVPFNGRWYMLVKSRDFENTAFVLCDWLHCYGYISSSCREAEMRNE